LKRNGNVILFGPGSGISDGRTVDAAHASRLTGFSFDAIPSNEQRRVQVVDFDHPITRDLDADAMYGSPTAFGPAIYPADGLWLGRALGKQGRHFGGLALKSHDHWHALFTTAGSLPAALWRGIARFAGAHVWCDSNDVLLADSSVVALHCVKGGRKTIRLPHVSRITDLITGATVADATSEISLDLTAPATAVYRHEPAIA
jgi:hypothetical protein